MTDAVETTDEVENEEIESAEVVEADAEQVNEDPTAGLKKALAAERKAHRDEIKARKAAEQALADKDKPAEEAALDTARREARDEARSEMAALLVNAKLEAALSGKVTDPAKALRLVDISEIEVTDGRVDSDSLAAAVDSFLAEWPELASKRFTGTADQGAKGKDGKPSQMTHEEVKRLSAEGRHDEIVKAEREGRLNDLMNR